MLADSEMLLRAIRETPNCDFPRLVYADWLEENGDPERATIIRYQICNPVRPPYGGWGCQCGVPNAHPPCNECLNVTEEDVQKSDNANAVLRNWDQQYYDAYSKCRNFEYEETAEIGGVKVKIIYRRGFPDEIRCTMREWCGGECQRCGGIGYIGGWPCSSRCADGRTPGIAKAVCEAWPVTRVVLTDVNPRPELGFRIELELFNVLNFPHQTWWATKPAALSALSHAAINYGRRLAGLPDLKQG